MGSHIGCLFRITRSEWVQTKATKILKMSQKLLILIFAKKKKQIFIFVTKNKQILVFAKKNKKKQRTAATIGSRKTTTSGSQGLFVIRRKKSGSSKHTNIYLLI